MGDRIRIWLDGADEMHDLLRNVLRNEASNILRQVNYHIAQDLAELMKQRVKHRSGKLASTIFAVRQRSKDYQHISDVRGGHEAPYGFMLEFGTSKTRAQPFILPSAEEMSARMESIYREDFGKQLEKVAASKARKAAK